MTLIIPAILTADVKDLERKLAALAGWAPRIHIDVADGRFVSNRTLSLKTIRAAAAGLPIDYHLMVADPLRSIEQIGQDYRHRFIIHYEALAVTGETVDHHGDDISIALNPSTRVAVLESAHLPAVTLMSIVPGYQGSQFLPEVFHRLALVRDQQPGARITVDGGVNQTNIHAVVAAGADEVVVGSAIWRDNQPEDTYQELLQLLGA